MSALRLSALKGSEVSIVPGDLPREQAIFHARARADVMHDQVALRRFVPDIDDEADVLCSETKVPRNDVAWQECRAVAFG